MTKKEKLNQKLINTFQDDYLSEHEHLEDIKNLISQGADIHTQNDVSLIWASCDGCFEIVKYLVELGANIHAENNGALRGAVDGGNLKIVKYFILEHGSDIQIVLDTAKKYEEKEIIEWCESYIKSKELNDRLKIDLSSKIDKINNKKIKV